MGTSTVQEKIERRSSKISNTKIVLFALLIIFPFLVATLSANIANLRNEKLGLGGAQSATSSATAPPVYRANQAPFQLSGGGDFYLYFYIGVVVVVATILFLYLRANARGFEQSKNRLSTLLGIGIVVLIFGTFILVTDYAAPYFANAQSSPSTSAAGLQYLAEFAIIGGAVLASVILFLKKGKRRSPKSMRFVPKPVARGEEINEFKNIFDQTAYSLRHGSDHNRAIIQCYKSLLGLLKSVGVPQRASLTPRELEAVVLDRVPISSDNLHQLTLLFESARYGKESLTPNDVGTAQRCLEKMSSELDALQRPDIVEQR